jgi:predicted aconitase
MVNSNKYFYYVYVNVDTEMVVTNIINCFDNT